MNFTIFQGKEEENLYRLADKTFIKEEVSFFCAIPKKLRQPSAW